MAITAAGWFGLTIEKMFIDTAGQSMEAETHNGMLVTDSYTPDYTVHDFRNDVTNEVTGTGYTAGGVNLTTTEITLASGTLTWDMADTVYSTVTVSNAMAQVDYFDVGSSATDQLLLLQDFVTAVSATAADLTVQHSASGVGTADFTP